MCPVKREFRIVEKSSVQSIDRVLDIIEALAKSVRGITLTDLAEMVSLHKSTVHRLLSTLVSKNYVLKDPESGKYRLTMRMFEIGSQVVAGLNIVSVARPYLEHLSAVTDEAIHLVVRDGTEIVYLYKEDPSSMSIVNMASRVGLRNPLYCTAVGKSILAALPEDEAEAIWDKSTITRFTNNTITTFARMKQEMAQIREKGYAIDNEEHERGVRCIAVAIRDFSGNAVAAISVSASASRLDDNRIDEISSEVMQAASSISRLLGAAPL